MTATIAWTGAAGPPFSPAPLLPPSLSAGARLPRMLGGEPIHLAVDTDFSGISPQAGISIERGMTLAMDEINEAGGVLGRPLRLIKTDNRGVPARGIDNLADLTENKSLVAVVGGLFSPVMLAQLHAAQASEVILISPWAAATGITENGFARSFIFRVSVNNSYAGNFLIKSAKQRGFKRPGLLLWRSGWGTSNENAMTAAIRRKGLENAGTQWFNATEKDLTLQVSALMENGADVIMLVSNAQEGMAAVQAMAPLPARQRIPFISHWGITGGEFHAMGPDALGAVDLSFLQTYSFFVPPHPEKADRLLQRYCEAFGDCGSPAAIVSPVGTAHAYDIVHLVSLAIETAGETAGFGGGGYHGYNALEGTFLGGCIFSGRAAGRAAG